MGRQPPRSRLVVPGLVVVLVVTVYAHAVPMFGMDGRRFLPPFQSDVIHRSLIHLGAENFRIGYRVARGQGFADPFGIRSGPTAWMPPVYPVLCAGLVLVFGKDVDAMGLVMGGLQAVGLMVVWCAMVGIARPRSRAGGLALLGTFVLFLLTHFRYSFLLTHDYSLAILGLAAILRFAPQVTVPNSRPRWAGWGLVGGLATLATPALAAAWGLVSLAALRQSRRGVGLALLTFTLTLAPWTIRNAVVFGKFIPVKSNAVYELYQSLKYSEDGLVTADVLAHHPGNIGPEMYEYRELGEAAYLSRKADQARELLAEHPGRYARHCLYRLWAIAVWDVPFPEPPYWAIPRWFCRLTYPLPFLGLLVIVYRRWWRVDPAAGVAVLAAVGLAIPYVLLSYYDRYEYAFGPAKMLLTYYGLKALVRPRENGGGGPA